MGSDAEKKDQKHKKEINGVNYHGTNKFIRTIEKGEVGLAMAMLEQGADVDFRTQPRPLASEMVLDIPYAVDSTPLHVAALLCNEKIIALLLQNGADVAARNSAGQTPLDCALLSHAYLEADLAKKENAKLRLPWAFNKAASRLSSAENAVHLLRAAGAKPALFSLPEKFSGPRTTDSAPDVPPPLP